MIADVVIANMLRIAREDLDGAKALGYPSPAGRIPDAPSSAKLAVLIEKVEATLNEASSRFGVDLNKRGTPANTPRPIR